MPAESGPSSSRGTPSPSTQRWRSALWIASAAALGFVAGFLLQAARLNQAQQQIADASAALHAARLEATLSAAVIEAQGGRFEMSRQLASDFYSGLQRQLLPVIEGAPQSEARAILAERDSIITALARNDPSSPGTLESVLLRLRRTVQRAELDVRPVGPVAPVAPVPPTP